MINRNNIERNIDYLKYNDGIFHEVYVAMMINDVMNIPLEWIDNKRLNEISDIIDNNEILNENVKNKIMDIEKEIEDDKFLDNDNNLEIGLWGENKVIDMILGIVIGIIILFLYCSMIISSECSRKEEEMYERDRR